MGIGEAIAKAFADRAASVVLLSRDASRAESARGRIGHTERTLALSCDVRNREEIERVLSLTLHHYDRIDVWINNAGYGMLDSIATMSMEECRKLFDTNFFGALDCMQIVIPTLKAQGNGTIINISSIVGHLPVPHMGAYSATKHALNAISEAARLELEASGIRVMSVCPGRIRTNFGANTVKGSASKRLGENLQRGISPERCARAIIRGYLRGPREVFVPWHGWLVSHLYEVFPAVIEFGMRRMMK
jgi:short-subunit dehydrogenase